ncbi:hypothetical protein HaLaN_18389, partial [Haematococcus lacustris]
ATPSPDRRLSRPHCSHAPSTWWVAASPGGCITLQQFSLLSHFHHLDQSRLSWAVCCAGQSVYVSGPFPVTGKVYNGRVSAVMFGPITGNGKNITFSTCFSGNADWDSFLALFQTNNPFRLSFCGGSSSTAVAYNNNSEDDRVFPVCQFGSGLSTFTSTMTAGTNYWLFMTAYDGSAPPNSTVVVTSSP